MGASHADGFINAFLGHGTGRRDPFASYIYTPSRRMTDQECMELFTYNGIAQKIITAPADEAVKEGFTLKDGEETMEEQTKSVLSVMEDLEWEQRFSEALSWDRLYGGSAILMLADDGTAALDTPLNEANLRNIERLVVVEAPDITTNDAMLYSDPQSQLYGRPEFYEITGYYGGRLTVHESRLIMFRGGVLPKEERRRRNDWGAKIYEKMFNDIMRYDSGLSLALMALSRLSQGILKLAGLADKLSYAEGEKMVMRRLQLIDMARHMMNTMALDESDTYDQKNMTINGITDIIDRFQTAISAATDIPVTVLFGISPGGLNATGKADFENYYNMVRRIQKRTLKPQLSRLIDLLGQCSDYGIALPDKYTLEFNPLWQLTEKEQADTEYVKAQTKEREAATAKTYYDMNALDGSEMRDTLEKNGDYELDRSLDDTIQNSRLGLEPGQPRPNTEGNDE